KTGLEDRRRAGGETVHDRRVEVEAGDVVSARGEAGGDDAAKVPQPEHAYVQSSTPEFSVRKSTVRTAPSRIDRLGAPPSDRTRAVSRKMNGLSPIHPRSPPAYERSGATPSRSLIQPIESSTSQYSSVPRLKMFTRSSALSIAVKIASMQSWT